MLVVSLLRLYKGLIQRHRVVTALVAIALAVVLSEAFWFGKLPQHLAYLAALALSVVIVDLLYLRRCAAPLPVRRPRLELAVAAACLTLSFGWLYFNFRAVPTGHPNLATILFRLAGMVLVLNIPVALMDLLALRYGLGDLGFRFAVRGVWAVPLILLLFFGLASLCKAGFTVHGLIEEEGSLWKAVLVGIFVAALPEEFFRMTWQTRLGAVTGNHAAAWYMTAWLWSFMHAPIFHRGEPSWTPALINCLNLVPLGLLWGYVMHRTQSLHPSMLLHMFNFSGLQNF
jgi:membrane protease YdiL (CAAX protease family)